MSTQNIPKQNNQIIQNNSDYLKDLKDISKEIDKIYKKLSKDEDFAEILENIKTDFIKNNIAIIEDNLSKPNLTNYKDFNGKIIKMLDILIHILTDYTYYKNNKAVNDNFLTYVKKNIDAFISQTSKEAVEKNKLALEANIVNIQKDIDKATADNLIKDKEKAEKRLADILEKATNTKPTTERLTPDILSKKIDEFIKDTGNEYKSIIKNICVFNYYLDIYTNNDAYGINLDENIKETDNLIKSLIKDGAEKKTSGNDNYNELINAKDRLKKYHEDNKKIYKDLFNYIQLSSFEIFENVSKIVDNLLNDSLQDKNKAALYNTHINEFKTNIYYEIININNTQVNDDYAKLKDNSYEKIDLDLRKKTLGEMKELLDKQLNKLNDVIKYLISSKKEEYSAEITDIRKIFKDYSKEKEYKDTISALIVNEEIEVNKLLSRNLELKKFLETTSKQQRGQTGGEKKSSKYYEDKYKDLKDLDCKIKNFIKKIKEYEGIDDGEDPFEKNNNMTSFGDTNEGINSIYKNIWNDYIKETKKNKSKGATVDSLKQDNRLYERFKENELDPNDILKISFQDKIIFICIILIIRTFTMVFIEFLIEYNIVSTLYRGIVIYSVIYILLIICSTLLINYDSYKLRILVNYLNLHINSSNIFFHILLFILFICLILIIINNNDLNKMDIDNVLNYTYIYKYLYEIAEKSKPGSDLKLSQKEKVKLQYRLDIITMIVFIFSSLLILIM